MDNGNWKIEQEMARLQLDIDNLEKVVNTRLNRIKKRMEKIKNLTKDRQTWQNG